MKVHASVLSGGPQIFDVETCRLMFFFFLIWWYAREKGAVYSFTISPLGTNFMYFCALCFLRVGWVARLDGYRFDSGRAHQLCLSNQGRTTLLAALLDPNCRLSFVGGREECVCVRVCVVCFVSHGWLVS